MPMVKASEEDGRDAPVRIFDRLVFADGDHMGGSDLDSPTLWAAKTANVADCSFVSRPPLACVGRARLTRTKRGILEAH